ncbi:hypothetical protein PJ311_14985 [Bacillus sp. CLL-7-23]|uniref:Uncharacterized protein n=1 Tax=Bacillus changyiensis TaxID=3004103 RepID=A0ABT4X6I1_9BACI|nr:hypothetical protein [Bacillus changyiensis]MDA7027879.1 hypothetical protein [Bacillus changyiensis]
MKKIVKLLVVSVVVLVSFTFLNSGHAEAAVSSWQKPKWASSGCKVRIWTDATTYTKRAKTVDFTIEQNRKCGKLYYDANLRPVGYPIWTPSPTVTGYFSRITPIKKLSVDISMFKKHGHDTRVSVWLFKNSNHTIGLGEVTSKVLHIHKQ